MLFRSSHLCGARKLIIFGRRKYDKRSCVGFSYYMTFERINGITNSNKNILFNDLENIEKLNEDDYILNEDIFYRPP